MTHHSQHISDATVIHIKIMCTVAVLFAIIGSALVVACTTSSYLSMHMEWYNGFGVIGGGYLMWISSGVGSAIEYHLKHDLLKYKDMDVG